MKKNIKTREALDRKGYRGPCCCRGAGYIIEQRTGNGVRRWFSPCGLGHCCGLHRQSVWTSAALNRQLDAFYANIDARLELAERLELKRLRAEHKRFLAKQRAAKHAATEGGC